MRTVYETAFERETDSVLQIVASNKREPEYAAMVMPVKQASGEERKCRKTAALIMNTLETACATLSVVSAVNGDWQSAFVGAAILLALIMTGRVVK